MSHKSNLKCHIQCTLLLLLLLLPLFSLGQGRSIDDETINTETWRTIQLVKAEADGSQTSVSLLRPLWWLEEVGAVEGGVVSLDLHEVAAVGEFQVKSIGPCPEINPEKQGFQPVTGKFIHENAVVLDFYIASEADSIGVTANHPIWSETDQEFKPAGDFQVGEKVKTVSGVSELLKVEERPGLHTVHNLEVHRDHVYYVGDSGVLVHNKDTKVIGRLDDTDVAKGLGGHDVLDIPNWSLAKNKSWVDNGIKNKQSFYMASPIKGNQIHTTGKYKGQTTVYRKELDQLQDAGYVRVGDYLVHPDNVEGFMRP
jgi:hypothetical protein